MRFSNGTTLHLPSRNLNQNSNINININTIDGYDFNRARSSESTEDALAGNAKPKAIAIEIGLAGSSNTIGSKSGSGASNASSIEDRGVPVSPKKVPMTPPRDRGSPYNHDHYNYSYNHDHHDYNYDPSACLAFEDSSGAEARAYDVGHHYHHRTLLPPSYCSVRQRQLQRHPFWGDHSPSNGNVDGDVDGDTNGFHLQRNCNNNTNNTNTNLHNPPSWRHRGGEEEDVGFWHANFQNDDDSIFRSSSFDPNPMGMSLSREHDSYYSIQRSFAFEDGGDSDE